MHKSDTKDQMAMFWQAHDRLAERDRTFLDILPTLTHAELTKLIATHPERWYRYNGYLKSLEAKEA